VQPLLKRLGKNTPGKTACGAPALRNRGDKTSFTEWIQADVSRLAVLREEEEEEEGEEEQTPKRVSSGFTIYKKKKERVRRIPHEHRRGVVK